MAWCRQSAMSVLHGPRAHRCGMCRSRAPHTSRSCPQCLKKSQKATPADHQSGQPLSRQRTLVRCVSVSCELGAGPWTRLVCKPAHMHLVNFFMSSCLYTCSVQISRCSSPAALLLLHKLHRPLSPPCPRPQSVRQTTPSSRTYPFRPATLVSGPDYVPACFVSVGGASCVPSAAPSAGSLQSRQER